MPRRPFTPPDRADPLASYDFSSWVERIVDTVGRSWRPVLLVHLLILPGLVLLALYQRAAGTAGYLRSGSFYSAVVHISRQHHQPHPAAAVLYLLGNGLYSLLIGSIVGAASTWLIVHRAAGTPAAIGPALRFGLGRMWPLAGWSIVGGVLAGFGLVLLVVPGVYVWVVISTALHGVVVIERAGIRRAFRLARGTVWMMLWRLVVLALAGAAFAQLVLLIGRSVLAGHGPDWVLVVLVGVLQLPFSVVGSASVVVLYAELRSRDDRTLTPGLRAALDGDHSPPAPGWG